MSEALCPRDEVDVVEAALLRARALLTLNRSEEALGTLRTLRLVERPRDEYLTAQMLTGVAFSKLDQGLRAVEILRDAHGAASSAHRTVRAEIALHLGIAHYRRGEHADAERLLSEAAEAGLNPYDLRPAFAAGFAEDSIGDIVWDRMHGTRKRIAVVSDMLQTIAWREQQIALTAEPSMAARLTIDSAMICIDESLARSGSEARCERADVEAAFTWMTKPLIGTAVWTDATRTAIIMTAPEPALPGPSASTLPLR